MVSEESPLLETRDGVAHKTIYDRFTPEDKRWIVFVVSLAGSLPSKQSPNTLHYRDAILISSSSIRFSVILALHSSDS
jgi:hypothetical protein